MWPMSLLGEAFAVDFDDALSGWLESGSSSVSWDRVARVAENWYWDLRGGVQTLRVNGTEADFGARTDDGGDIIRWTYRIEKEWLEDLLENLRPDDVLFDVGANLGCYACFAARKLREGRVVAFEPYPPNLDQLRENVARNGDGTRVMAMALSDAEGTLTFEAPAADEVGHAIGTISDSSELEGYSVETRTADRLVEEGELPRPTVVKVDVEGSEPRVLNGMKDVLSHEDCRLVYLEIHLPKDDRDSVRDHGSSAHRMQEELAALGFTLVDVEKRNRELHVKAEK